jgi:integrase
MLDQTHSRMNLINKSLSRLMVGHALRVSEALALKPEDVANGYITVRRLKGSQRREAK